MYINGVTKMWTYLDREMTMLFIDELVELDGELEVERGLERVAWLKHLHVVWWCGCVGVLQLWNERAHGDSDILDSRGVCVDD